MPNALHRCQQVTQSGPRSKPLRWLYLAVAGHGYYPLIAVISLATAIAAGFILFVDHFFVFSNSVLNVPERLHDCVIEAITAVPKNSSSPHPPPSG
ncbi:hypothetical protein R3Q08_26675 [Rhodococcus erythropolis]|nr:hypothetical protein [Rhodococcus erythropolis]